MKMSTPPKAFANKTILLTGSTTGIGRSFAHQLASLTPPPSKLILPIRSPVFAGEPLRSSLLKKNSNLDIRIYELDLARYESVLALGRKLEEEFSNEGIDIAVLNAGMGSLMKFERASPPKEGEEGHEMLTQVNILSNALLGILLLPLLNTAARRSNLSDIRARLTFVSTGLFLSSPPSQNAALKAPSIISYLDDPANYSAFNRYVESKLIGSLFFKALAHKKEVIEAGVLVNSMNPGMVRDTDIDRALVWWFKPVIKALKRGMGITLEQGAENVGFVAGEMGVESRGEVVDKGTVKKYAEDEESKRIIEKIWKEFGAEFEGIGVDMEKYIAG